MNRCLPMNNNPQYLKRYFLFFLFLFPALTLSDTRQSAPDVMLARIYAEGIDVRNYWVSEKLDGVRARWNGDQFISRQGNIFHAPEWFTKGFPSQTLDGELWIKRNSFEQLVSTVRTQTPDNDAWRKVRYMVFDLPDSKAAFSARLEELDALSAKLETPYLRLVKQFRVDNHATLMKRLQEITLAGGEGLMLHHADSLYSRGRSADLLKLKPYFDAEAHVIRHLPGKGKYTGMLGALLVEMDNGKRFKIGTGFSDEERSNPPPVGAEVTYKYFGKTRNGLPRFASFLRIKNTPAE